MAMVFSTSKDCVLQQYPHHPSHDHPSIRAPQLKLPSGEALQDGQKCSLILRRPILEPLCQLVLSAKDFNSLSYTYEKGFSTRLFRSCNSSHYNVGVSTNLMHIAEILVDSCGQISWSHPKVNGRISASLDSDEGKTDGARKALEQMFQGKTNLSKKWEEEIKKRELTGGDGSGVGGGGGSSGWGGGGGDDMSEDFGGQEEPWDWEEFGQTFMATFVLIILYFSITHGPKQVFRLFKLFFRYVRQGFRLRKIPEEYLQPGPGEVDPEEEYDDSDADSDNDADLEAAILSRRTDIAASDTQRSNVQDNPLVHDESEESEDDRLPPPPEYKKENRIAKMQAERKEKVMQMLTPKGRRGNEDK